MEIQLHERFDSLDTFFEGLEISEEAETQPRSTNELLAELSNLTHVQMKLSSSQQRLLRENPSELADLIRKEVETSLISQTIARIISTIEMRIGEPLDLQDINSNIRDWRLHAETILDASYQAFNKRQDKLIGDNGQISKDLDILLGKLLPPYSDHEIFWLLLQMPKGSKAMFDRRTHRRIFQQTNRLVYSYFAAKLLEEQKSEQITDMVLEHLESALITLWKIWGHAEFTRLENASLDEFEVDIRKEFLDLLDLENDSPLGKLTLSSLELDQREIISEHLGRRILSNIYRQLLLGVITELWVDYLTQMEALRVSIGLEAYAQRDPLVQYKGRASELFQNLQSNIRLGVISRMFTYQPRDVSRFQTGLMQSETTEVGESAGEIYENESSGDDQTNEAVSGPVGEMQKSSENIQKKRRRRRR